MNANIELREADLKKLVEEHLTKKGIKTTGVQFRYNPGCMDQRDYESPSVTVIASVILGEP